MKNMPFLFLLFFCSVLKAQKEDHVWLFSHTYGLPEATQLDFNYTPPELVTVEREMYLMATNASICDKDGNLLMYTNGIWIANKLGEMMENGDSLNPGDWANAAGDAGYVVVQGAFFIQKPGNGNLYYLFHMFTEYLGGGVPLTKFYYSLIDLGFNNGLGKVVEKNVPLLTGDYLLNYNQATAVRHANGRDWWIVVPNHMQPQYFRFLLTPEGIQGPWMQEIGFKEPTDNWWDYSFGHRIFSLDGVRFADYDFLKYIQVFDFDRCTGLLSNPVKIDYQLDPSWNNGDAAIAFSPSGRFLYMTRAKNGYELVQYDVLSPDIQESEQVLVFCNEPNGLICGIGNMLLGPDGRIYVDAGDTIAFHVINKPDSLGLACEFSYKGFPFPVSYPNGIMPYFPNYRLGALEGSECDSITSSAEVLVRPTAFFIGSPNPASGPVTLQYELPEGSNGYFIVSDIMGREIERHFVEEPVGLLRLASYDSGLYLIRLVVDGKVVQSEKLIQY